MQSFYARTGPWTNGLLFAAESLAMPEYMIYGHTVDGFRLPGLLELGRKEKADVKLELGIDYLDADLTKQYKFW
jgi:hypothetical protein